MKPEILLIARVPPLLVGQLAQTYTLHNLLEQPDGDLVERVAPNVRAIVANGESHVTGEFLAQFPALELLTVFGVGYDGVDVPAATALGIPVTNTPDVLTEDVADLGMALMLATARRVVAADRFVRADAWKQGPFPWGSRVSGARLGIVGMGRIGQAVAQRAAGFNMSIAYSGRTPKADSVYRYYPTPQALAFDVDILVVCTVGGSSTRGLIDAGVLDALGPDGILVNIARGSVVDEKALIKALQDGRIAGAGLDVFENEPVVPSELFGMDNVVLTPHIASGTLQTRTAMADLVAGNLAAHFAGKPLLTQV